MAFLLKLPQTSANHEHFELFPRAETAHLSFCKGLTKLNLKDFRLKIFLRNLNLKEELKMLLKMIIGSYLCVDQIIKTNGMCFQR